MKKLFLINLVLITSLVLGCANGVKPIIDFMTNAHDYDHQDGLTVVTHNEASYRVYAQKRKSDSLLQILIEPATDGTSLIIKGFQGGVDGKGKEWINVFLDVDHRIHEKLNDITIDNASVLIKEVDEFSTVGVSFFQHDKLHILYNGNVTFDEKFHKMLIDQKEEDSI